MLMLNHMKFWLRQRHVWSYPRSTKPLLWVQTVCRADAPASLRQQGYTQAGRRWTSVFQACFIFHFEFSVKLNWGFTLIWMHFFWSETTFQYFLHLISLPKHNTCCLCPHTHECSHLFELPALLLCPGVVEKMFYSWYDKRYSLNSLVQSNVEERGREMVSGRSCYHLIHLGNFLQPTLVPAG